MFEIIHREDEAAKYNNNNKKCNNLVKKKNKNERTGLFQMRIHEGIKKE